MLHKKNFSRWFGQKKKGMSLLEVVVATGIFVLVMVMISGVFASFYRTLVASRAQQRSMEDANNAVNLVAKVLRTSKITQLQYDGSKIIGLYAWDYSATTSDKCYHFAFTADGKMIGGADPSVSDETRCDQAHATIGSVFAVEGITGFFEADSLSAANIGRISIQISSQKEGYPVPTITQTSVYLRNSLAAGSSATCQGAFPSGYVTMCLGPIVGSYTRVANSSACPGDSSCKYYCTYGPSGAACADPPDLFKYDITSSGDISVIAGETATKTITVTTTGGPGENVDITVSGDTNGGTITYALSPVSCNPGTTTCTSELTITTQLTTTPGAYPIAIDGTTLLGAKPGSSPAFTLTVTLPQPKVAAVCGDDAGKFFAKSDDITKRCAAGSADTNMDVDPTWPGLFTWNCSNETQTVDCGANYDGLCDEKGWAWGGGATNPQGDSGLGWIKLSSTTSPLDPNSTYAVKIPSKDGGTLDGYAWNSNFGWISFKQSDLLGCPSGTCAATRSGNNVEGWARILSATLADGWKGGWIKLNGSAYGVQLDANGVGGLTGQAWSEDLGWVQFRGATVVWTNFAECNGIQ